MPTAPERNIALVLACAEDPRPMYKIAAASDINPTLFGRICHGRERPTPAVRARIAAALGRCEDDLFEPVSA